MSSLSRFIRDHRTAILDEWDAYAGSLDLGLSEAELRNDAARLLDFVAADIETSQTGHAQHEKSQGRGPQPDVGTASAAQEHGAHRHREGFSYEQMVSEYRALRATVLRLWLVDAHLQDAAGVDEVVRFNEAIDQLVAESLSHFVREVEKSRQLFLGILGHDLRSPLSAIQTTAHAMLKDPTTRESDRLRAERILRGSERMRVMVSDLLDLTRTHMGTRLPIDPEACDVASILQNVADEIRASTNADIRIQAFGDTTGRWDCARMGQLASNLLGNAVQHGARDAPIVVTAAGDAGSVILTVHNSGPAIPEERRRTAFDPFVRGPDQGVHTQGLGLGLYICRQIVVAHGGSIALDSSPTGGTTVRVQLPRKR